MTKVRIANEVRDLVCLRMLICTWSGARYVVAQPASSLQNSFPPFRQMLQSTDDQIILCDHGHFDSKYDPIKRLKVMTPCAWADVLAVKRVCGDPQRETLTSRKGAAITGKPTVLPQSEHYCEGFAAAVAQLVAREFDT